MSIMRGTTPRPGGARLSDRACRMTLRAKLVWVAVLYFAQGFPYMVVRSMSAVFFTDVGMSERFLGYLNFLGIPWTLKFLWAPFVDIFSTRRSWMILVQALLTVLTALLAALCLARGAGLVAGVPDALLVWLFIVMAFVEGESLARRIRSGLKLGEALDIAIQGKGFSNS